VVELAEKKVFVSSETAQPQGTGQWATYCAVLLDEDGNAVFSDFIVQLYLGTRVVATVYLRPDVYKPTGELCIGFQVPKEFTRGTYSMHLFWREQMDPNTLTTYLEGQSSGISYIVVEDRNVLVSNAEILHPQAPGQWTSFKCTVQDDFGQLLHNGFYLQILSSSPEPVHIPIISEFLGFTNSINKRFYVSYKPINGDSPLKVYIEGKEVSNIDYWVNYDEGFIEFYNAPAKGGPEYCPGMAVTVDYVAVVTGNIPLGGVVTSPDVYKDFVLQFAFKVPEDFKAGTYPIWLKWGIQVVGNLKYSGGESNMATLLVTTDVRNVIVKYEWLELPMLYPGQKTSYHAIITDELGEPLPPEVATELLLKRNEPYPTEEIVVAKAFLSSDVYNPISKEAKISFTLPKDTVEGVYTVKLKWYEHVTAGLQS
jgi:hypothetical protein